MVTVSCC